MKSKIALVTGASSGIGYELARQFARGGWELHLVARREDLLQQLAAELHSKTHIHVVDLADSDAREQLIASLAGVEISCLINNAGFGDYAPFAKSEWPKIEAMLRLNMEALVQLTHAFLPSMLERRRGKILNVASLASFFPGPGMAIYHATKAFVLSFSEALATEAEGTGVTVTCLCPGVTTSEFQQRAGLGASPAQDAGAMTSAEVARIGYQATIRGQRLVIPGRMNTVLAFTPRLFSRVTMAHILRNVHKKR